MLRSPYIAPVATVFGLVGGLAAGLSSGLLFGLTLGLLAALAAGLGCGLTVALVLGLSGELLFEQSEQLRWSWSNLRTGLSRALFGGLAGGLVFGLLFALVFGASAGLTFGLVFGLTVALAGGLSAGLGFGLVFALTVAMVFGGAACLQHYVVRAWLVRDKIAPWQYGPFLEAMAQRLLLRRSGSAYLFTHRLLRDYLADPNPVASRRRREGSLRTAAAKASGSRCHPPWARLLHQERVQASCGGRDRASPNDASILGTVQQGSPSS